MQYLCFYIRKKLPDFSGSFSIHILLNDMYALLGANSSTFAAANALALIDVSKVVFNGDSTVLAGLHALHAADAACLTSLHSYSALILVVAHYKELVICGDNFDNAIGAGLSTNSATDAVIGIDACYTVNNADSVLGASLNTVAKTKAAKSAGAFAAEQQLGSLAGLHALVFVLVGGVLAGTITSGNGNHGDNRTGIKSEQSTDSICCISSAGNTEVCSGFLSGNKSLCIGVTACVSASAAVCTGQTLTNLGNALINGNSKHHSGD